MPDQEHVAGAYRVRHAFQDPGQVEIELRRRLLVEMENFRLPWAMDPVRWDMAEVARQLVHTTLQAVAHQDRRVLQDLVLTLPPPQPPPLGPTPFACPPSWQWFRNWNYYPGAPFRWAEPAQRQRSRDDAMVVAVAADHAVRPNAADRPAVFHTLRSGWPMSCANRRCHSGSHHPILRIRRSYPPHQEDRHHPPPPLPPPSSSWTDPSGKVAAWVSHRLLRRRSRWMSFPWALYWRGSSHSVGTAGDRDRTEKAENKIRVVVNNN